MVTEAQAQRATDRAIRRYRASVITVLKFASAGTPDRFKQSQATFSTGVPIIGRAIHHPTKEQITVIGDGERYEIAFLFSRLEMLRQFPLLPEGKWVTTYDRISWNGNTYKLEKVQPTGQVGTTFSLVVALGSTAEGDRVR
jgi:hypothetical protein